MPKSVWNSRARQELLERLERLAPEAKPRWGKMNAPQMLAHLRSWMQMAKGELKTANKNLRPVHPAFGDITTQAWGVLAYRHTDHHLRQFGV